MSNAEQRMLPTSDKHNDSPISNSPVVRHRRNENKRRRNTNTQFFKGVLDEYGLNSYQNTFLCVE
jgi:hypothetical protein